jgi:hypothetical protein
MKSVMRTILVLVFVVCAAVCTAQNFGGFPPATPWKQINTDTARIIFSPPARQQATRIAQVVHTMAADTAATIANRWKKINIVLHNNTTQANGYVALGPFRSEFYLIPGGDIFQFGNLPWHENLAIHEYRHVQQYNAFNNGLTKVFSFLGGQNGRALANALTIPDWFFEGDAVWAETAFTGLGRGRQPYFLSGYNSLWQEGKRYNWMKLRNGSYKDFVPNHYPLGYLLVNYGYLKYGKAFWNKVTSDASSFRGVLYPFQRAVKKYSHGDFKKFRRDALQFYNDSIPVQEVRTKDAVVTNYYFPQAIGKDSLLYLKESYRQLPAFYIRDSSGEHKLKFRNISTEDWFSYASGKLAYTAFNTDKRWSLIDYSDIFLLDIATKKERRLTTKGRYYTPTLAPDARQLIAVAINNALETELHLINAGDGAIVKTFASRAGDYFIHPKFIDAEHIVVSVRSADGLLSLQRMNLITGRTDVLIAPQRGTIGNPSVSGDTTYFTASASGNDDLYAYHLTEKKLHQLTAGTTGNYYAAVYKDSLVWSKFTTMGLQLEQQALSDLLWREVASSLPGSGLQHTPVAAALVNVLNTKARPFAERKYAKTTGLINIHSWDPGLNFYSNNILNTFATSLYYRYNEAERAHTAGFSAAYAGWFPVLSTRFEHTFNRHVKRLGSTITANETEASIGYNIPLNFSGGKTIKGLNFGTSYVYNNLYPTGASKDSVSKNSSQYLSHFLSWTQQLQRTRQQIYPRLGYSTALQYRHRLDEGGYQWLGSTSLYLPTFSKTHALVLTGSFQQVDTGNVLFSNRFSLARGYTDYYYSRMWNAGFNYHLPLLYPDWGVANLVYFLRLRTNLFFDYSTVFSKDKKTTAALRSTGAELYFDTRWWNQLPVSFGVRYSYLLDKNFAPSNRHVFEAIIPIDLVPF